ncbi:LamG-like jellyroll fold domain-containing protein [Streptomyces sp. NPDC054861]
MFGRKRSGGRRAVVTGCCVAAVVAAVPGTAHAAENLPPRQPLVADLQNAFQPCATGDEPTYVSERPVLTAVLYDPEEDNQPSDANRVSGDFEAWWTDAAGAEQRRTFSTPGTTSGSNQRWQLPQDIPADTVVSWHVRADDSTATSAWSSENGGAACRFVYDDTSPTAPVVTSPDYAEEEWQDGVGRYGSFTMDSASPDVVAYRYSFIGGPYTTTVKAEEPGGPATIRFLPTTAAPNELSVEAIDRAGRSSGTTTYWFRVKSGRAPVAHWRLADAAGSTTAAAETGPAAKAGQGVSFGAPAPAGSGVSATATLDGGRHGHLTPGVPAVDTRKTFAVAAWVRPSRTDRVMTVASQDTGSGAGFTLGLRGRASNPTWSFAVGGAQITGGAPETGEWAHLLGLYDTETGKAQLYVNGYPVSTPAQAAPAAAPGAFQIGRVQGAAVYKHRWHGQIGDVRAYDRVVVPAEVTALAYRKPQLLGHWSLETATDGASPEQRGGAPLRLGQGATIHRGPDNSCIPDLDPDCPFVPYALVGDGNLKLDGESGYAATDGPVVDTGDSFTIGAVVRLSDVEPDRPMTVLSQAGKNTDAFKVRYEPATRAWQLVVPVKDEAGAAEKVVSRISGYHGEQDMPYRLAVVYDDATDTIKLFMNGYTNEEATAALPQGWQSTGPLQVGRGTTADGWGEYLRGDIDEVQAYAGALREKDIAMLGHGAAPCLC